MGDHRRADRDRSPGQDRTRAADAQFDGRDVADRLRRYGQRHAARELETALSRLDAQGGVDEVQCEIVTDLARWLTVRLLQGPIAVVEGVDEAESEVGDPFLSTVVELFDLDVEGGESSEASPHR